MDAHTNTEPTATAEIATLLVSFELSRRNWLLTLQPPKSAKLSRITVAAHDKERVLSVLTKQREQAERRLCGPVKIVSIYEAGLDGFWLHRWLTAQEIDSHVVDPASILGPQRRRQAKTDRIDGEKLLRSLGAWLGGDRHVCSMVVVPSTELEDRRRLTRERDELVSERTRVSNRIGGLLANQGIVGFEPLKKDARAVLRDLRTGDGHALLPHLRMTIDRALQRLDLLVQQIKAAEAERNALLRAALDDTPTDEPAVPSMEQRLFALRSIGPVFATALPAECLHRQFDNGRQVGSFAGLTPTPYASGSVEREQGISKAGNRRLRKMMIELAWMWQRHQPDSALTRWFHNKVRGQNKRSRRIAIVALARKLLVALWRYVNDGVVPEGAALKRQ